VQAVGLVGSLGRGDADDWSDVDLMVVVPDDQIDRFGDAAGLPGCGEVVLGFDGRHNSPRGTRSAGGQYVIDGLPLWVDWYAYPVSRAGWATDAEVVFDRHGIPRLPDTFAEHLATGERQPPTPKGPNAHRLLQVGLVPVAAKRIVRGADDAARMVEFVGGRPDQDASPAGLLEELRGVLASRSGEAPPASLAAAGAYLDLVAEALGMPSRSSPLSD